MNMKKNEVISTQKEEKGKAMLTTAGAVVTGAVAGAGVDRLFFEKQLKKNSTLKIMRQLRFKVMQDCKWLIM